jgi:putative CRISPR-associated protein (TIGR02619 family)
VGALYRFVHVIPIGTSLLGNYQRDYPSKVSGWGFDGWDRWAPDDSRQKKLCDRYSDVLNELIAYISVKGAQASAELLPFERACSLFGHGASETLTILYSTQTCNARLAREAVASYLRERGFHVAEAEIRSTKSAEEFEEGLVDLVDKVVRLVIDWKKKGAKVFINATPGFKAEASFLVIASLMAGADIVYYMHESFRDIVILPSIPLEIKREYMGILTEFLEYRDPREAEWIVGSAERLRDLEIRGLIKRDHRGYIARKWIRKLLELTRM